MVQHQLVENLMAGGRFVAGFAVFSGINYAFRGGMRWGARNLW
ncbi:hypothetical protein [Chryseobacterium indoltheticum]